MELIKEIWDAAGGGGAGGLRTNTLPGNPQFNITSTITMPAGTIPVAVGDGGGGSTAPAGVAGETGSNGGNSSIGSPGDSWI